MASKYYGGYSKTHYYYLLRKYGSACPPGTDTVSDGVLNVNPSLSDEDRTLFNSLPDEIPEQINDYESDEDDYGSDSDEESESPESNANEDALDELRYLVCRCGITSRASNLILKFMSKHSNLILPKTYKTLMRTPKVSVIPTPIGQRGQYVHRGIRHFFRNTKLERIFTLKIIILDIGIDGISFFNSSKLSGWPIIGRILGLDGIPPFLIGIYTGPEKPESFDELMTAFCDEIDEMERETV